MDERGKLLAVKNLIETDNLHEFKDIFLYVTKKEINSKLGLNYYRFLDLVKNPKRLRVEEIYSIAKIIGVTPAQIFQLIATQIDGKRSAKKS